MSAFRINNRGAALVEFAIVALLLFTLVLGIIEFGLLIKDYLALNQGAREGARSAALRSSEAVVVQRVKDSAPTLEETKIEATPYYRVWTSGSGWGDWVQGVPGDDVLTSNVQVRMKAAYPHRLVTGSFFSWMVGGADSITLTTNMVMRRE